MTKVSLIEAAAVPAAKKTVPAAKDTSSQKAK